MINTLAELITAIQQSIEEVFDKPKVNPPNCIEDDLAELEPSLEELNGKKENIGSIDHRRVD
jgi:hypothetical protein